MILDKKTIERFWMDYRIDLSERKGREKERELYFKEAKENVK